MINRKAAALILILLFTMSYIPSFCADYDNHWAAGEIVYLSSKGVISGDSGGIRPDDPVKRAELAKMINRNFGLTEAAPNVFPDLFRDDWYYNDILIGYKAGYLKGNGNGVNPAGIVTRCEAAVIISRLIGKTAENNSVHFSDSDLIPEWALSAVNEMCEMKIISGYGDGTFRPYAHLTRAEACVLIVRIEDYEIENINSQKETHNEPQNNVQSTSISSVKTGGGGSGGGGASGNPSNTVSVPSVSRIDMNTFELYYTSDSKGKYTVKVTRTTDGRNNFETLTSDELKVNISDLVHSLMTEETKPEETFTVAVKVTTSKDESSYSAPLSFTVKNPSVVMPEIKISQTINDDGSENISIWWDKDETVSEYEILLDMNDGAGFSEIEYTEKNGRCEYVLSDAEIKKISGGERIRIDAKGVNETIIGVPAKTEDLKLPLFAGTEGELRLIANERHFNNICTDIKGNYKLIKNIRLTDYTPFEFCGVLKGDDSDYLKEIEMNIDEDSDNVGLFTALYGSFEISDICLKGKVKGNTKVGALTGITGPDASKEVTAGAKITNVINYAAVNAASYAGGLIGRAYDNGSSNINVSRLINFGKITSSGSYAGGLFGLSTTLTNSELANCGEIKAGDYAGGLCGWSYMRLSKCYNSGKVTAGNNCGGLIGQVNSGQISNCFNIGSSDGASGGGLFGRMASTTGTKVTSCYNAYDDLDTYAQIRGADNGKTTYVGCYYRSAKLKDDGIDGTYPLLPEDMTALDKYPLFNESIWEISSEGYPYPKIKNFPVIYEKKNLNKPEIATVIYSDGTLKIALSPVNNSVGYYIGLYDSVDTLAASVESDNAECELPAENLIIGEEYKIKAKALGDGRLYTDSPESEIIYKHKPDKLTLPKLSESVVWEHGEKESYKVSWEAVENAAGYIVKIEEENYTSPVITGTSFAITEDIVPLSGIYTVRVCAVSEDREYDSDYAQIKADTRFSGLSEINGEKYYVISNVRQLGNISDEPGGNYAVTKDIGDDSDFVEETICKEFSGKLIGRNSDNTEDEMRKIHVLINEGRGLFTSALRGFYINNITLNGSIKSSVSNTGGFIGEVKSASEGDGIFNCVNNAEVYGKVANNNCSTFGGFIGRGYASNKYTLENCINHGNITSGGQQSGGLIGLAAAVSVKKCANYGEVTSRHTGVPFMGGLVGQSYANIEICFNYGTVTGKTNIGGISGAQYGSGNIKNSFNMGYITATGGRAGGITGYIDSSSEISKTYNSGIVTGSNAGPIYGEAKNISSVTLSDNYYLADYTDFSSGALSSQDMRNIDNLNGFSHEVWVTDSESGYPYPFLKDNPYKE